MLLSLGNRVERENTHNITGHHLYPCMAQIYCFTLVDRQLASNNLLMLHVMSRMKQIYFQEKRKRWWSRIIWPCSGSQSEWTWIWDAFNDEENYNSNQRRAFVQTRAPQFMKYVKKSFICNSWWRWQWDQQKVTLQIKKRIFLSNIRNLIQIPEEVIATRNDFTCSHYLLTLSL